MENRDQQKISKGLAYRSSADHFLLSAAFALGVVGILFFKFVADASSRTVPTDPASGLWGVHAPALMAAAWTAIVLIGYAFVARRVRQGEIEPETTGDNCYYLGFLFTLTSLAVTLFQLGLSNNYNDGSRDAVIIIISGFGIALLSTIAGIALRVWFFQHRVNIVARQNEIVNELQLAVRNFRSQVSIALADIKKLSVESVQLARERDEKLADQSDQMLQKRLDALAHAQEGANQTYKDQAKKIEEFAGMLADSIEKSFEKSAGKVTKELAETARNSFAEVLSGLEHPISRAGRTLDSMAANNERFASETTATLDEMNSRVVKLSASMDQSTINIERRLDGFATAAAKAADSLEQSSGRAARASQDMFSNVKAAAELRDEFEVYRDLEVLSRNLASAMTELSEIRTLASSVGDQVIDDAKQLVDEFSSIKSKLVEIKEALDASLSPESTESLKVDARVVAKELQKAHLTPLQEPIQKEHGTNRQSDQAPTTRPSRRGWKAALRSVFSLSKPLELD